MSKRVKLMLASIILAVLLVSASNIVIPNWAISMLDVSPAATEIAGFRGGGSPS